MITLVLYSKPIAVLYYKFFHPLADVELFTSEIVNMENEIFRRFLDVKIAAFNNSAKSYPPKDFLNFNSDINFLYFVYHILLSVVTYIFYILLTMSTAKDNYLTAATVVQLRLKNEDRCGINSNIPPTIFPWYFWLSVVEHITLSQIPLPWSALISIHVLVLIGSFFLARSIKGVTYDPIFYRAAYNLVAGVDLTTKNVNFGIFPIKQQVEDEVQTYNLIAVFLNFVVHFFLMHITGFSYWKFAFMLTSIIFSVVYKSRRDNKVQTFLVLAMLSGTTSVVSFVVFVVYVYLFPSSQAPIQQNLLRNADGNPVDYGSQL